ncbi:MAG: di-heme-cytochrome C peroxidase [Pseudomonadota bacterium]
MKLRPLISFHALLLSSASLLLFASSCKPSEVAEDSATLSTTSSRPGLKSRWLMPWPDSPAWKAKWSTRLEAMKQNHQVPPVDSLGNPNIEARSMWYNTAQGSFMFPLPLFLELELDNGNKFASQKNMSQFGFVFPPDSDAALEGKNTKYSLQGLPLGFVKEKDKRPEMLGSTAVGVTCAACHTGEIVSKNVRFVIDGGQPLVDFPKFQSALVSVVTKYKQDPNKLATLCSNAQKRESSLFREETDRIYSDKSKCISHFNFAATYLLGREKRNKPATNGGPGRLDAVAQLLNELAATHLKLDEARNTVRPAAPISFPHLWNAPHLECVQTNCLARNPLTRNMGEVTGVFGYLSIEGRDESTANVNSKLSDPQTRNHFENFLNSVGNGIASTKSELIDANFPKVKTGSDLFKIFWLEDALSELPSPKWSEAFKAEHLIDQKLAARGKEIYFKEQFSFDNRKVSCAGCHVIADLNNPASLASEEASSDGKKRFFRSTRVAPEVVGTDMAFLMEAASRTYAQKELPLSFKLFYDIALKQVPNPLADKTALVIFGITNKFALDAWIKANNLSDKDVEEMTHFHSNSKDFAAAFYKARPLDGIAFSAPYLHNGSVPSLYDLFMVDGARPNKFQVGTLEYDDKKVGYKTQGVGFFDYGTFEFDTSKGKSDLRGNGQVYGNRNSGHAWGTGLEKQDKIALVEYLKSL